MSRIFTIHSIIILLLINNGLMAKINILTTSEDLASITKEIVKDKATVENLAQGKDDLHFLSARPDFILKASKADMFVLVGLDLEIGWANLVIESARNKKIKSGNPGYCDASSQINAKGIPTGKIDKSMGDVHAKGNPHYWTDPINSIFIARQIFSCVIKQDLTNQDYYRKNLENFISKAKNFTSVWIKKFSKHTNKKIITYHDEFLYLLERFKLKQIAKIEKISGVSPSTARIHEMVELIKNEKINIILVTPWSNVSISSKIASMAKIKIVILPIQTGYNKVNETYFEMLEHAFSILEKNL